MFAVKGVKFRMKVFSETECCPSHCILPLPLLHAQHSLRLFFFFLHLVLLLLFHTSSSLTVLSSAPSSPLLILCRLRDAAPGLPPRAHAATPRRPPLPSVKRGSNPHRCERRGGEGFTARRLFFVYLEYFVARSLACLACTPCLHAYQPVRSNDIYWALL